MTDNKGTYLSTIDSRAPKLPLTPEKFCQDVDMPCVDVTPGHDGFIAVIESRVFLGECIRGSMQTAFSLPVVTYSTLSDLQLQLGDASAKLVMLSLLDVSNEACAGTVRTLSELVPSIPIVVLAATNDLNLARTAMRHGALGFIPCTLGFEIAIEAMRFVLAGGNYVPVECLLGADQPDLTPPQSSWPPERCGGLTGRELAVVRSIQQGKSNKVIAHELNMSESTVKVHVRNIMKKLNARNRTEVAIKTQIAA